jgi:membrane-bound lytic murein transglycosylase D
MDRIKPLIIIILLIGFSKADDLLDYTWTENDPVLIDYIYKNKDSLNKYAERIFKRGEDYLPYIYSIAEKHNVPKEIAVVAAIESSFNPNAISHAGATGMWQFMEMTGRDMGIVTNTNDFRKDWKKSTEAAIRYLKWLSLENFDGDYELAILAYNGGVGRVKRAMKAYDTNNPWELIKISNMPSETKEYLPKFISYVYYYHYVILNN